MLHRTDPDDIFTIAYTSGSTGKPKGCVFSRKLWLNHIHVPTVSSIYFKI